MRGFEDIGSKSHFSAKKGGFWVKTPPDRLSTAYWAKKWKKNDAIFVKKMKTNDKKMTKKWRILRKNYNFLEILTSSKTELVLFFIYNNHFYSYMQDINYKNKTKLKLT